jgi:putative hydrolase of the HAD superfamily
VTYRAVIFDLWDTLVLWPMEEGKSFHDRMAGHLGIDPGRFGEAWSAAYDERTVGPIEPSVRSVCRALGVDEAQAEGLIRIRVEYTREVLFPREGALGVLVELRRRGYRLGLISVCSEEVPTLWRETPLAELIDEAVFSCSVGVVKPERKIYEIAAARLGVEPLECLFIDDRLEFVTGAVEAGMDAYVLGHPPVERLEDVLQLLE